MPLFIPEPRQSGTTTTTKVPLYWARYGPNLDETAVDSDGSPVSTERPTLIVLHGGPGADHRYLLPQMLHLAKNYDVLFYDQRGSGKSRAEDNSPVTWLDHVEDLGKICEEFDIAEPSLIGYSWGAMLTMLYSIECAKGSFGEAAHLNLRSPSRIVLMSPGPVNMEYRAQFDENMRVRGSTPDLNAQRAELMESGLRDTNVEAYRQRLFELGVSAYFADTDDAVDLTPFRVVGRVQQSVWDSLGDYDLVEMVSEVQIDAPILVVHGRQDPIPFKSAEDLARALGTEVEFIDNCGHVPYVEQPDALWSIIDKFLDSTDPK